MFPGKWRIRGRQIAVFVICLTAIILLWQLTKVVPTSGDWQTHLAIQSHAEFNGNMVTVKNIRNFRYAGAEDEASFRPAYYDKTYDLTRLVRVWYIAEPFKETTLAAHTFLSFEFSNGDALSISIEARKRKGQDYDLVKGLFRTYPLLYIAADERDAILVRTNIRKDDVYMYPVKTTPEKARLLLADMLKEMNRHINDPEWYNTFTANCTSKIAFHVNRITPGRLPNLPWQSYVTGYADRLALERDLLDVQSGMTIEEARERYFITQKAQEIGDVVDFSAKLRTSLTTP